MAYLTYSTAILPLRSPGDFSFCNKLTFLSQGNWGNCRSSTTPPLFPINKRIAETYYSPKPLAAMDNDYVLNDRMVKLVGIPALGLLTPNLSGLITNPLYSLPELCACY